MKNNIIISDYIKFIILIYLIIINKFYLFIIFIIKIIY